jgi:hypothetical protein
MGGVVAVITWESGPWRGKSVVGVIYKKSSLSAKVKFLKGEVLLLTV